MTISTSLREFTEAEIAAAEAAAIVPALLHNTILAEFRALDPDCLPEISDDTTEES